MLYCTVLCCAVFECMCVHARMCPVLQYIVTSYPLILGPLYLLHLSLLPPFCHNLHPLSLSLPTHAPPNLLSPSLSPSTLSSPPSPHFSISSSHVFSPSPLLFSPLLFSSSSLQVQIIRCARTDICRSVHQGLTSHDGI